MTTMAAQSRHVDFNRRSTTLVALRMVIAIFERKGSFRALCQMRGCNLGALHATEVVWRSSSCSRC